MRHPDQHPTALPLSDPRWTALHAEGKTPAELTHWLALVLQEPDNLGRIRNNGWSLCSDEVTWSAAFAAVPHLLTAAKRANPSVRAAYLQFIGTMVAYRVPANESELATACPEDLEPAYTTAVIECRALAADALRDATNESDVRRLLATVAACKGFPELARRIIDAQHGARSDPPEEEVPF